MEEFPEPDMYFNRPGWVKSNPLNNESYLEKCCEAFPCWADVLRETHAELETLIPGYNISQIKEKFLGLRYYIGIPEGVDEETARKARDIAWAAEEKAGAYYVSE